MSKVDGRVFICYAREDNESADKSMRWLDRLTQHLAPLVSQGQLTVFSDRDIRPGEDWHQMIQSQLEAAKVAVLLVTPAFLASEYIANSEMPALLKKAAQGGLKILPIHISPSNFETTRFRYPDPKTGPEVFTLAAIQAAHPPSKTLEELKSHEQNRVFVTLSKRIIEILEDSHPR